MAQVVKSFLGLFFLLFLTVLGCGIISAQLTNSYAREFKGAVICELENSSCNQKIVSSCISQAKDKGYELQVILHENQGRRLAEVILEYKYEIPILGYKRICETRGYAV